MRFDTITLWLAAVVFAGFGLVLLAAPGVLAAVDLAPATATARSDARAVFGGLELGVGAFLAMCARRPAWRRTGLALQGLALGGVALGRLVSLALDGVPRPLSLGFGAMELAGAVLAVAALRALPPAAR